MAQKKLFDCQSLTRVALDWMYYLGHELEICLSRKSERFVVHTTSTTSPAKLCEEGFN